ncbi:MAG: fructose-1,6-bisphosphatase [Candidatus Gracilibacteria bacterium]|jgi:fructose-1,6-bisphosphatase I|nr:fructose-1,6-bisphosphatase [Candidatus Gracilibacteria bacterium]
MPLRLLNHFLSKEGFDKDLTRILFTIAHAGKYVAHAIRTGDLGLAGTSNLYGEHQVALDVLSDKIFTEHLKATNLVYSIASEEQDNEIVLNNKAAFSVAFDPLDGSSLIDTNLSVGSIFAIFKNQGFMGQKGRDMVAACYLVYGPRTIFVCALEDRVIEFTQNELGEFVVSKDNIKVKSDSKTFSPGNLRATIERDDYSELVSHWQKLPLTLRYSGGMVADIHQIFSKESGIFTYPSFSKYPNGKLRLLFECAPFAFIAEKTGALAVDEKGREILDIPVKEIHQRTTIMIGSSNEIGKAIDFLN